MIEQFQEEYRWLSNFCQVDIPYGELTFPSVEHFYVAMKTEDQSIREEVSKLSGAAKAKTFGKTIELREDWDEIKLGVMKHALLIKYQTEPYKTQLLETGSEYIQEGNNWGDSYWGVDLKTGKGENKLGVLIMDIRSDIRKGEDEED